MKKAIWLALALVLALSALAPALADHGEADIVSTNGVPQHLTLASMRVVEGQLQVIVDGFTDGLLAGRFGEKLTTDAAVVCGGEEIRQNTVIDTADERGRGVFWFFTTQQPEAVQLYPWDESGPVTLWEAGDPVPEP